MILKVLFALILTMTQALQAASWKDNKSITAAHPCYQDASKFCKTSTPDDANRWRCLGQNYNELSPKCSVFMKAVYKKTNDCASDIFKICTGESANYGKWNDCLKGQKNLAPQCVALLNKSSNKVANREKFERTCQADFDKLCPNLKDDARRQCAKMVLQKKANLVSKDCISAKNNYFGMNQ